MGYDSDPQDFRELLQYKRLAQDSTGSYPTTVQDAHLTRDIQALGSLAQASLLKPRTKVS